MILLHFDITLPWGSLKEVTIRYYTTLIRYYTTLGFFILTLYSIVFSILHYSNFDITLP